MQDIKLSLGSKRLFTITCEQITKQIYNTRMQTLQGPEFSLIKKKDTDVSIKFNI